MADNKNKKIAAAKGNRRVLQKFSTADLLEYCDSELIRVVKSKRRIINAIHRFWEYESTDSDSTDSSSDSDSESDSGSSTESESDSESDSTDSTESSDSESNSTESTESSD